MVGFEITRSLCRLIVSRVLLLCFLSGVLTVVQPSLAHTLKYEFSGVVEDPLGQPPDILGLAGQPLTAIFVIDSSALPIIDNGAFTNYLGSATFLSPAFSGPLEGPARLAVGYGTGLDELVLYLLDPLPGLQLLGFRTTYCVGIGCLFGTGGLPTSLPPLANGSLLIAAENLVTINSFAGQVSVSVTSSSVVQIEEAVLGLPVTDFQSPRGHPTAMVSILRNIEAEIMAGSIEKAIQKLQNLLRRVDGCGSSPDKNDWVTNCVSQVEIRTLLDQLINNLSATP